MSNTLVPTWTKRTEEWPDDIRAKFGRPYTMCGSGAIQNFFKRLELSKNTTCPICWQLASSTGIAKVTVAISTVTLEPKRQWNTKVKQTYLVFEGGGKGGNGLRQLAERGPGLAHGGQLVHLQQLGQLVLMSTSEYELTAHWTNL